MWQIQWPASSARAEGLGYRGDWGCARGGAKRNRRAGIAGSGGLRQDSKLTIVTHVVSAPPEQAAGWHWVPGIDPAGIRMRHCGDWAETGCTW